MKKSLQIPNEINDVITAMVAPLSITSISENSGVSTIITTTVTIFDNLSTTMLLQDGMIVTLDSINYVVSNVINSLVQSFDITATGLTATEWSIAANFKPGTRKEINQILDQDSGSLDRFPLIWLILPNSKDYDNEVIDFTTEIVLVFAHKSNDTDRSQKRYDENISPVIQPLLDLFLLWVASSDFNYMFEFEGYQKAINYNDSPFAYYGNDDKTRGVLEVDTDAIEVSMELNFKKQFVVTTLPVNDIVFTAVTYQDVISQIGINVTFTGSNSINFGTGNPNEILITDIETTKDYDYLGRYNIVVKGDNNITKLIFDNSKLIELQIDSLIELTYLDLNTNSLPNISIVFYPELTYLDLSSNNILSANIDIILELLDDYEKGNGTLFIRVGNENRTSSSDIAYANLISKGWAVDRMNKSDLVNNLYTTFIGDEFSGFSVTSDGSSLQEAGTADELVLVLGEQYMVTFDLVLNAGVVPQMRFTKNFAGSTKSNVETVIEGSNSHILIPTDTFIGILEFRNFSVAVDYTISNLVIQKTW